MLALQEERAHFSHSQLVTMLSCPYKYYLTYIQRRGWDFLPSAVSFGSAVHEALGSFHKSLQNGGDNSCINVFRSSFTQSAEETVFKDDDEFDELMRKGQELIAQYTESFHHLKPSEVDYASNYEDIYIYKYFFKNVYYICIKVTFR
jgi:putative RecB family exonuclease